MSTSSGACNAFCGYLSSSIGRKQIMAVTGLGLCGFLVAHLLGNFSLLVGPEAFNFYAHTLTKNKTLLYIAEAGLLAMFLTHILLAFKLTWENKKARDVRYHTKKKTGRGETFASATMPYTGIIILIFLVLHLLNLKFGTNYTTYLDGEQVRDLYKTTIEYFASPLNVAWYLFSMIAIAFHTGHGFQSTFQSLGINHPKYTPAIKKISCAYAFIVSVGFGVITLWCYLQN